MQKEHFLLTDGKHKIATGMYHFTYWNTGVIIGRFANLQFTKISHTDPSHCTKVMMKWCNKAFGLNKIKKHF